jgi:hypothetical protein
MKRLFLFTLFAISVSLISCQQSEILDEAPTTGRKNILTDDDACGVELRIRQQLGVNAL